MTRRITHHWAFLTGVAAVLVVVALVVGFLAAGNQGLQASDQVAPDWPTNASGLTYGSGLDATSPENEPDLLLAQATNGKIGYVLKADLNGPEPRTPEEALSKQALQLGKDRVIPVYLSDGMTQIGVFVVNYDPPVLNPEPIQ